MDTATGALIGSCVTTVGMIGVALITRAARHEATTAANEVRAHSEEVMPRLKVIEERTDGRQDERIRAAVAKYAEEHPGLIPESVAYEAMRDLLDAIVGHNLNDDENDDERLPWRLRHRRHDDD